LPKVGPRRRRDRLHGEDRDCQITDVPRFAGTAARLLGGFRAFEEAKLAVRSAERGWPVRIPTNPATHSNRKPATDSDLKPAGVPI
jgi:hypothetical protein